MVINLLDWNTELNANVKNARYFNDVVDVVANHLLKNSSIAVLQNIPCYSNNSIASDPGKFFLALNDAMSEKISPLSEESNHGLLFDVLCNAPGSGGFMTAVIVTKKIGQIITDVPIDAKTANRNKFVSFIIRTNNKEDYNVLAVHRDDYKNYPWDIFRQDINSIGNKLERKFDIIVGDFNIGINSMRGLKTINSPSGQTREKYIRFKSEENYTDKCGENSTYYGWGQTGLKYESANDHILVKNHEADDRNSLVGVPLYGSECSVNYDEKTSHHYPIYWTFEI